jgi:hypothetical protein
VGDRDGINEVLAPLALGFAAAVGPTASDPTRKPAASGHCDGSEADPFSLPDDADWVVPPGSPTTPHLLLTFASLRRVHGGSVGAMARLRHAADFSSISA